MAPGVRKDNATNQGLRHALYNLGKVYFLLGYEGKIRKKWNDTSHFQSDRFRFPFRKSNM